MSLQLAPSISAITGANLASIVGNLLHVAPHGSRHMRHMRMSLKAQTHFNTIRNVQMRHQHFPPISVFTTPYALTPPPLPSLCSRGALLTCS
ncbi:hypothetical protein O181_085002 [Austropuccinia psidii MF-1]|uniref:Uncharacterized protein n=1 Tax=Austropuccinia psidii MF-1 TaxID=1389203 RepID=A0A9Q3FV94_9BASI|nr:hypothetical protein [Austropuccinia psidii MF-1]